MKLVALCLSLVAFLCLAELCPAGERVTDRVKRRITRRRKATQRTKGTKGKADTSRDTWRLISDTVGTSGRISDQKAADHRLEQGLAGMLRRLFKAKKGKLGGKDLTAATQAEEERDRARAVAEQRAWRRRRSRTIDLLFFFNW